MSNISNYLQQLAGTIGPRPVASDTERTAAEWIASAFRGIGLPAEIQDFETNCTTTWSNFLYFGIALLGVFLIGLTKGSTFFSWLLFILLVADAVGYCIELNGGRVISRILSKGPSQNVIARYTPRTRPGDTRHKKVVIVAHYDSLRVSPLTENSGARIYQILTVAARYVLITLPALAFLMVLPFKFLKPAHSVFWIIGLVLCVIPLILMLDLLIRGTVKRFSAGANNNASGVAAMLEAAAQLVGGKSDLSENLKQHTQTMHPVSDAFFGDSDGGSLWMPSDENDARSAGEFPEDFSWASSKGEGSESSAGEKPGVHASASSPTNREASDAEFMRFATMDFGGIPEQAVQQPTISFAPVDTGRDSFIDEDPNEILGPDLVGESRQRESFHGFERKKSFWDNFGAKKKKGRHSAGGVKDEENWFGLDSNFDARTEGKKIGSWDNFGEDIDDDGFSWKGGAAGGDVLEDYNFASESAARIRRKFDETFSSSFGDDKELWFVATGAFGVHGTGMKRFLEAYGAELRDAFIINVENVGAGQLRWYTQEGAGREYSANVRMTGLARRASKNLDIRIKGERVRGVSTDATVALQQKMRAVTITRLGKDGLPINWRSMHDTVENVDLELVEEAAQFIAGMAREA